MKIAIINKSDSRGGAAVVSYRLAEALQEQGAQVSFIVAERLKEGSIASPATTSRPSLMKPFLTERLKIFLRNGFDRSTLFKIDTGSDGLPLHKLKAVKEADAIILNWVNQGTLSLKGVEKLLALGKPVVWVMHDMWNLTGICHHAGRCRNFTSGCAQCPMLKSRWASKELAHRVWLQKQKLYNHPNLQFVAVSHWLAKLAEISPLTAGKGVKVIGNPFFLPEKVERRDGEEICIAFGAARLDDPIKNLPLLHQTLSVVKRQAPEVAANLRLLTFGGVKNASSLENFAINHTHLGVIKSEAALAELYSRCAIVISTSDYETLPGTLVEGQAYGAIPVSTSCGGQADIIDHRKTGWLAPADLHGDRLAESLAEGILWAAGVYGDPSARSATRELMSQSVSEKFGAASVAQRYIETIESVRGR